MGGVLLRPLGCSWRSLEGSLGLFWGSAGVDGHSKRTPTCPLISMGVVTTFISGVMRYH